MFPPMVSASPPPSDDELSADEGEELGVADSSFDITGLSQKLPVCQPPNHKPAAVSAQDSPPDPLTPSPAAPPVHRLPSDDWGEFSGGPAASNATGMVPPSGPLAAAPPETTASEKDAAGDGEELPTVGVMSNSETSPSALVVSPEPEPSIFSDSDSDSETVDGPQPQAPERKSSTSPLTTGNESVKPGSITSMEGMTPAGEGEKLREEGDKMKNQTIIQQNGTDEPTRVLRAAESESDGFDEFGSFSAATENDQFRDWSEPVSNSVDTAGTQPVTEGGPPPSAVDDNRQGEVAPQPVAEVESPVAESAPPASDIVTPASNVESSHDDFGGFTASDGANDQVNGDVKTLEGIADRAPSPDDFGDFAAPGEHPSSAVPVEDTNDASPVTDEEVEAVPPGDPVNAESSTNNSPKRAKSPDDLGASDEPGETSADNAPSADFGDFAAPNDDFGDFAAPTGDLSAQTDDFGDFSAPTLDFGDFSAPGESSGDAWPPDGSGGGGSAGFADFGAVFAAPADEGSVVEPLESTGQLADPADLSDDDFGDFEDFQAPVPKEPTAVTDEAVVSALLSRLFPPSHEEREPASVPLDASGVWYQLRETDSTAALQYRWSGCRAYTALLHALRVDASNIINFGGWGGRPGRFAAALDPEPLQPVKGPPVPEPTPAEQAPSQQPPPPTQHQQQQHQQQQQQQPVNEVPPAAFDWTSSGLKNPLESTGPEAYSLLDLDVFDTVTRPAAASDSFLSCLERELLTAEEPPAPAPSSQSGSDSVYSRLMAQTAGPALSEAANRVLTRIPDIDFMQAKVLMFPVRGE